MFGRALQRDYQSGGFLKANQEASQKDATVVLIVDRSIILLVVVRSREQPDFVQSLQCDRILPRYCLKIVEFGSIWQAETGMDMFCPTLG